MRVVPNEEEVKAFKKYEKERKPFEALSDEDRFMISVSDSKSIRQHSLYSLVHVDQRI